MNHSYRRQRQGFILIMSLWALAFLSVLAVSLGLGTRQKIMLLGRLEERDRSQMAAEAGVKKAIAVLIDDLESSQFLYSPTAKFYRHNDPDAFMAVSIGEDFFDVVCKDYDDVSGSNVLRYGLCDEQAKINVNNADKDILVRIIISGAGLPDDDARKMADAIIDWRDYGRHELEGFFSDEYYKNLEHPYDMKERPFERLDELLLVKGIGKATFDALQPFLTVWGDGRINVNTASGKVLSALGLDVAVVDKFLKVRRGQDGLEYTKDDHVFYRTFDIAAEINAVVKLDEKEMRQIDVLNTRGLLSTDSMFYSTHSRSYVKAGESLRTIDIVFNAFLNKFEYWYEK